MCARVCMRAHARVRACCVRACVCVCAGVNRACMHDLLECGKFQIVHRHLLEALRSFQCHIQHIHTICGHDDHSTGRWAASIQGCEQCIEFKKRAIALVAASRCTRKQGTAIECGVHSITLLGPWAEPWTSGEPWTFLSNPSSPASFGSFRVWLILIALRC